MPSFTTMFRAIVMLGVGAAAFKGWQMYGPPTEKVKSVATRAIDMAQAAWKNYQSPAQENPPAAAAPTNALPFAQTANDTAIVPPPLATQLQTLTPNPSIESAPVGLAPAITPAPMTDTTPSVTVPPASDTNTSEDRVRTLITRLEQLGGSNSKVAAWGSTGRLFRCTCQAPVASSASVMQHFEAVAAEPVLAIEQVVAKVEASRSAQRGLSMLR